MLVAMVILQLWCNKENYQDFLWKGRYSLALHNLINNFRGEKWMYIENSKTCMKRQNSVPLRNMKNRLFFLKWEHFQNHYGNHLFPCNGWIYLHRKALNNMCVCVCVCVCVCKTDREEAADVLLYVMKKEGLPKHCPQGCQTNQILQYTCRCIFRYSTPGPKIMTFWATIFAFWGS